MAPTIVVGWDGSAEAAAALDWALADAERRGRHLRLVTALEPESRDLSPRPHHSHAGPRATAEQDLAVVQEVQALAHPQVSITTMLVDDRPVEALVSQSRDAALLVLGYRGRGGARSLIAGSTTLAVAARSECTMVAVPAPREGMPTTRGIVVGIDGSALSEGAVAFAFEQASELGAPLRVVHVWRGRKPASLRGARNRPVEDSESSEDDTQRQRELLGQWVTPWAEKFPDVAVGVSIVQGNAVRALVDFSRSAQLLVVGCRGLGAVRRVMLGSVSQGILHLATVPVAVVPTAH
jgi:nucleotide-binding universal stress UspA family protein